MPTLKTSLSIPDFPTTSFDPLTPQVMPYAIDGTTAEPSLSREITGWVPAVPPPASEENWMRQNLWAWLARSSCTAAFTLRATVTVTLGGTLVEGDVLRLSYDGNDNDYVVTAADVIGGFALAASNWALQLTEDVTLRDSLDFGSGGLAVFVSYRLPGSDFPVPVSVSVVSGTTTLTLADFVGGTSDTPLMVSTSAGQGYGLPFLHGGHLLGAATKMQYYGSAKDGAFRAGKTTGTQSNAANVGAGSVAFGTDNVASGAEAAAFGSGNTASGSSSVCAGGGNTASASFACAIGSSNVASGSYTFAAGGSNTVSGASASALGYSNTANVDYSVALGTHSKPLNIGEVAIASGQITADGDAQLGFVTAKCLALGTTGTIMVPDSQGYTLTLPSNTNGHVYALAIDIVARWDSGTAGTSSNADQAYWRLTGVAFVAASGAVTLSGLGGITAPTYSQGHGNSYALNVSGGINQQLNIACYSNNAAVNARFVGSIRYTVA